MAKRPPTGRGKPPGHAPEPRRRPPLSGLDIAWMLKRHGPAGYKDRPPAAIAHLLNTGDAKTHKDAEPIRKRYDAGEISPGD